MCTVRATRATCEHTGKQFSVHTVFDFKLILNQKQGACSQDGTPQIHDNAALCKGAYEASLNAWLIS